MKPGDILENPVTGMSVMIIKTPAETDGRATVVEYCLPPHAGREVTAPHRHRLYVEQFEILSGRAGYIVGKEEGAVEAGQTVMIPRDTTHVHPWSISDEPLIVRQTTEAIEPDEAGLTATMVASETNFALARAGKVDKYGRPSSILQAAVLLNELLPNNYLAGIPLPVQRLAIGALASLGRLRGYRAVYPTGVVTEAAR